MTDGGPHNAISSSCYSSLVGANILVSTLFPNILSLCSSLRMREVSHSHKTGKIMVLCSLIFMLLDRRWEYKDSEVNVSKCSPNLISI